MRAQETEIQSCGWKRPCWVWETSPRGQEGPDQGHLWVSGQAGGAQWGWVRGGLPSCGRSQALFLLFAGMLRSHFCRNQLASEGCSCPMMLPPAPLVLRPPRSPSTCPLLSCSLAPHPPQPSCREPPSSPPHTSFPHPQSHTGALSLPQGHPSDSRESSGPPGGGPGLQASRAGEVLPGRHFLLPVEAPVGRRGQALGSRKGVAVSQGHPWFWPGPGASRRPLA